MQQKEWRNSAEAGCAILTDTSSQTRGCNGGPKILKGVKNSANIFFLSKQVNGGFISVL